MGVQEVSLGNGAHASIFTQDQTNGEQLAIKKFPDTPFGRNCFYNECIIFNKLKRKQNIAKVVSICDDSLSIAMKRYQCDLFTLELPTLILNLKISSSTRRRKPFCVTFLPPISKSLMSAKRQFPHKL